MTNFLESTAELDIRLAEYRDRSARIEAHLRRKEIRAASAQLNGFLEELVEFSREIELPLEPLVVGAQLGFMSGGELFRGRLPGAVLGVVAGWLYGQQAVQRHRLALEALAERVATMTVLVQQIEGTAPASTDAARATLEVPREAKPVHERQTVELERDEA